LNPLPTAASCPPQRALGQVEAAGDVDQPRVLRKAAPEQARDDVGDLVARWMLADCASHSASACCALILLWVGNSCWSHWPSMIARLAGASKRISD
jgi:hypothetical protein